MSTPITNRCQQLVCSCHCSTHGGTTHCGTTHSGDDLRFRAPGWGLDVLAVAIELAAGLDRACSAPSAGAGGAALAEQAEQVGDFSGTVAVDVRGSVIAADAGQELEVAQRSG